MFNAIIGSLDPCLAPVHLAGLVAADGTSRRLLLVCYPIIAPAFSYGCHIPEGGCVILPVAVFTRCCDHGELLHIAMDMSKARTNTFTDAIPHHPGHPGSRLCVQWHTVHSRSKHAVSVETEHKNNL